MANEEHLKRIKEEAWNAWRESTDEKPDLTGADLTGADLSRADLSHAVLSHADLSGADLSGADLSRADLSGADLSGADLIGANLSDANLSDAKLIGADLRTANLSRAYLSRAYLSRAYLSGADLGGAYLGGTVFVNVDLSKAKELSKCDHGGPSSIDQRTLEQSGTIPEIFLRGCGFSDIYIEYIPSIFGAGGIEFYSCFISYSSGDKEFAKRLHDSLQGRGIRCWLDEKNILPGEKVVDEIDRGIQVWDKVVLCCSKASLETSSWVDFEVEKAMAKERRLRKERDGEKVLALVPVDLDGHIHSDGYSGAMKDEIRSRNVGDFTGWEIHHAFEAALDTLVQALRADPGRKEPDPKPKL